MIANCGVMGLDWRMLDLSAYMEALEAFNEMHDPESGKKGAQADTDRLSRFLKAHGGVSNG